MPHRLLIVATMNSQVPFERPVTTTRLVQFDSLELLMLAIAEIQLAKQHVSPFLKISLIPLGEDDTSPQHFPILVRFPDNPPEAEFDLIESPDNLPSETRFNVVVTKASREHLRGIKAVVTGAMVH